ncbi:MAG: DUF4340 domain-containing protein [Opitutaceae bacterium]
MRTKVTLVLIFLNVALFFFIFQFERKWRQELRARDTRLRVLDARASNIQKLEIAGLAEPIQLERQGDDWMVMAPFKWPADPNVVKRILNELIFLEREASFTLPELEKAGVTLADYGLDKPALTLTFTPGSPTGAGGPSLPPVVLRIGAEKAAGNRLYLLSPDGERVLIVKRTLVDSLRLKLDELRDPTLFKIQGFEVRSFTVQAAAANNLRVRVRHEGNRWSLETPILARAGRIPTELAINNLTSLEAAQFPAPASIDATRTGLASPSLRITLEGNNRHETLLVGARTAEQPASGDESVYYARLEDRDAVFTTSIPNALVDTLRDAQEKLRERLVLDLDGRVVSGITLRAADQKELTLQRLEIGTAPGEGGAWQIVRRDPGATGTQTLPADPTAVNRLLQHLTLLSADEFRSDAPSAADLENWGFNLPERRITLTVVPLAPATRGPVTPTQLVLDLGLSSEGGGAVYAKLLNQEFVYRVRSSILSETPVVDRVFRDKRLRELPTGAQITGLSLVRTANGSVIYARALGENETWKSALAGESPTRQAAIERLLAQLRTLRAQSIDATTFPATLTLDGVDQPWTYRLEVSVALVAGAGTQTTTSTLFLSERTGGGTQIIGSPDLDVVFHAEQALLDAFWTLIYGPRDEGPPAPETAPAAGALPPKP